jgi:hypothetical protein
MVEILAILASMAAVLSMRVERYLVHKREERKSRLRAFKTLSVTEAAALPPPRLGVLNLDDGQFNIEEAKSARVRNAWKEYLDQLACYPQEKSTEDEQRKWKEKTDGLLLEILFAMAEALHYDFGKVHARRAVYSPEGPSNGDFGLDFIRRSLAKLFLGNTWISIEIRDPAKGGGKVSSEERLRRLLIEHFEENRPIRVIIESDVKPDRSRAELGADN